MLQILRGKLPLIALVIAAAVVPLGTYHAFQKATNKRPAAVNPWDSRYAVHRPTVARVYYEGSLKDFATEREQNAWLESHWQKADGEVWLPLDKMRDRYLGDGKWTLKRSQQYLRKMALLADPTVEKTAPVDDDLALPDDDL